MKCWLRYWLFRMGLAKWEHGWKAAQYMKRVAGNIVSSPGRQCRDCGTFEELSPGEFKAFFGIRFGLIRSPEKLHKQLRKRLQRARAMGLIQ